MITILLIVLIGCGSIVVTVLGCVWMGTSYSAKKHGFLQGASQRELESLQQQVTQVCDEIDALKKQVQELIQVAKGIAK